MNDLNEKKTGKIDVRKWRGVLAVVALTSVIYWPALRGEFVWDDLLLVQRNPLVTGEAHAGSLWFRMDFPLSVLGFWLQWCIWGAHPAGFHIVNLLLHLANGFLLWRVLAKLKMPGCGLAAALFAVHPLSVASVAWISEFKNTLSLLFFLLSIWCWLRFEDTPAGNSARKWYGLALGAFLLALLAKTTTVALPVFLVALGWWRNGQLGRREVMRVLPFFGLALLFGLLTVWFQQHQLQLAENLERQGFGSRVVIAGMALWFYLGKALLPLGLCAIYPRWQPDATDVVTYFPIVVWCGLLALAWWNRRRWGLPVFLALGCFTAALFPVLGFFNFYYSALSRVSDHFMYLPLIAFVVLVAALLRKALPRVPFQIVAVAIVIGLSVLSWQRTRVYARDETLWRDTLKKNASSWTAYNNLACIVAERNRPAEAMPLFERSLGLNPRNASAHVNLGRLLTMQRLFPQAEAHFRAAIELKQNDTEARVAYADMLAEAGQSAAAIAQLDAVLRTRPTLEARLKMADLLRASGKTREAMAQSREALKMNPNQPELLSNLAWLLATSADASLRNGKDAVAYAEKACQLTKYSQAPMVGALAAAYAEAGRFEDAVKTADKAIGLANENGDLGFANMNKQLKQLYVSRKPYREGK